MKSLSGIGIFAIVVAAFLWSAPNSMAQGCDRGGQHTIQVQPDANGNATLRYNGGSGDSVRVCAGDTIRWVLTGSNRTFFVDFFSNVPFQGPGRRPNNTTLQVTIEAGPGNYNYDVGFDGDPGADPVIIVE